MRGDVVDVEIIYIWSILIGGYRGRDLDEILEWDPTTGQWKQMGNLKQARRNFAMDVVDVADVNEFCN